MRHMHSSCVLVLYIVALRSIVDVYAQKLGDYLYSNKAYDVLLVLLQRSSNKLFGQPYPMVN